jgi:hypothetical protein
VDSLLPAITPTPPWGSSKPAVECTDKKADLPCGQRIASFAMSLCAIGLLLCWASWYGRLPGSGSPTHRRVAPAATLSAPTRCSWGISLAWARRRAHQVDLPHVRSDGVRAAPQHPLRGARWTGGGAYLQPPPRSPRVAGRVPSLTLSFGMYAAGANRRTFLCMSAGQAVLVFGLSLVIIAMVVAVMWRKRVVRRRDGTPEDRYRRAIPDMRGGGIHPGGQPHVPPPPSNTGSIPHMR